MFKKHVFQIAIRYINLSSVDTISKISLITFFSIVVGVATAIVILSITNGFREDLKQKMIGKEAHISMIARGIGLKGYEIIAIDLKSNYKWIKDIQPYYTGQGLIRRYGDNITGVVINGITQEKLETYKKYFKLERGKFEIGNGNILLADTLAYNIGARIGEEIEVIVKPPKDEDLPLVKTFKIAGIFSTGYGEFDSVLCVISLQDAQKLFKVGKIAYGFNIMVDNPENVKEYKYQLNETHRKDFIILTWQDLNRNLFEAMYNQKTVMTLILFFFFVVVAFGILGTMMSLVLDKKSEIAILKALGVTSSDIMNIFILVALLLGIFGSFVGSLLGILITINLETITLGIENIVNYFMFNISYPIAKYLNPYILYPEKFEFFKSNVYYIKSFPTKVELWDIFMISSFAVFVSVLSAFLPASRASKLRPAEILRNE